MRSALLIPDPRLLVPTPAPRVRGIVTPRPTNVAGSSQRVGRRCRRCRRPLRQDRGRLPRRSRPYWSPLQRLYALAGDTWLDENGDEVLATDPSGDVRLANADQEAGEDCCECALPPVTCNCCNDPQPGFRSVDFTTGVACFSPPSYVQLGQIGTASERKVILGNITDFDGTYDVPHAPGVGPSSACNYVAHVSKMLPAWDFVGPTPTPTGGDIEIFLRIYVSIRRVGVPGCGEFRPILGEITLSAGPGIINTAGQFRLFLDELPNPGGFECEDGGTIDASWQTAALCGPFPAGLAVKGLLVVA